MKVMRSLKIDKRPAEKLLTAKIAKNCRQARKEKLIACQIGIELIAHAISIDIRELTTAFLLDSPFCRGEMAV
jgi:hypothetical protein